MFSRWFGRKGAAAAAATDAAPISPYTAVPSLADQLSDADLERLNTLLPWAAFTLDRRGRRIGRAHSAKKRAAPQAIPDPRIEELDRRYGLRGKRVLEIGCFEGIHTIALARFGADVTAVDSRIENVAKTAVRCAVYGVPARLRVWDVELPPPEDLSLQCDLLHHVGVLYHLADPVAHFASLLPHVGKGLLLDTHIAAPDALTASYVCAGKTYSYWPYREHGRQDPFSGMRDHAKWLPEATLLDLLRQAGFEADEVRLRQERNGLRALVHARRLVGRAAGS